MLCHAVGASIVQEQSCSVGSTWSAPCSKVLVNQHSLGPLCPRGPNCRAACRQNTVSKPYTLFACPGGFLLSHLVQVICGAGTYCRGSWRPPHSCMHPSRENFQILTSPVSLAGGGSLACQRQETMQKPSQGPPIFLTVGI